MKNDAIISEMFEEIKSRLVAIEKKLGSQTLRQKEPEETRKSNAHRGAIEEILQYISRYLSAIYSETNDIPGKVQDLENKMLSKMEEVRIIVNEQEKERVINHRHVVDLKSSKVVVAFVIISLTLLGALAGNVYQYKNNLKMEDNDLKYRYIQMQGGINSKGISKLEDIFQYHRNNEVIHKIREEVGGFERKVRGQAEELEREKLDSFSN